MLIKRLIASSRSPQQTSVAPGPDYPLEFESRLGALHSRIDVRRHLEILHGDLIIGEERFTDLYFRCLEETGTAVTPFNVFQRFQTRHDVVRYFVGTLSVPGARVECGAYRGATALLLCHAWRSRSTRFEGDGFYLVDSFSGTPASTEPDFIPVRTPEGGTHMEPFFPAGKTDVQVGEVRQFFRGFPGARIVQGWIPDVLHTLQEEAWAFVHLDLTLYEPTLAALRYFYEKLSPGGVLICDGSIFCPGAQKAVDAFSSIHDVPYAALGHRESVFVKP